MELDFFSKLLKENRSELVRDLVEEGRKMKAMQLYKSKKLSLGLSARLADISLSEFLDLLEEYHIPLNLTLDDAKQAMNNSREVF